MQRRPDVYLELALLAVRRVSEFLEDSSLETYLVDPMRPSSIERQLEIAGDALGQLRKHAPEIFSRIPGGDALVAFRNVLAHGYATVARTYPSLLI